MKALSIQEPYASLILDGFKTMETRSWKTNYRGRLYIHAGKKEYYHWKDNPDIAWFNPTKERGCIIGYVDIVDCIPTEKVPKNSDEIKYGFYGDGRYAWVLQNPCRISPVAVKGKLGLFNLDEIDKIKGE